MKYDNLMILASFDFILQTILVVFLTFIILGVLLTFFVYKIHINYAREIKELREDAQRLREEKITKLSEDSISTLDEAKKNIQQIYE